MKIPQTALPQFTLESMLHSIGHSDVVMPSRWSSIAAQTSQRVEQGLRASPATAGQVGQLSGLLAMQVEVTRYQLRVELVSKVSESAVATLRKLQQNQ